MNPETDSKPTIERFIEAVKTMAFVIPFFPKESEAHRIIAAQLSNFIRSESQLQWLVENACGHMRDWERSGGILELRGIFCTRFVPADGIETSALHVARFTSEEIEARYLEKEILRAEERYQSYLAEAKSLGIKPEPFQLPPGANEFPKPKAEEKPETDPKPPEQV